MAKQNEGRAALASRRPSECLSRQNDITEVALSPLEIQTARLRAKYDFSPSLAAVVAAHAFVVADRWGRA
ncbi:hypothetical protein [Methylobacterium sp. J-076]|uniref:hypothetical protein n=1 Tax=Methylobacterium sp. J-076 TaxID=2836655 RepID=UPI001FB96BB4|nr:hypothetical protein [Methylobacterium sp. J-076]MCJ2014534.1 hypothetical protein [Methylobacterium sp. J-076]